ncbi:hypothetical protein C1646_760611 [Rhizophagus diaphanus]|nr:hypothetical protein C1646_760611 [Rhizophagus diaphanus] [Rhizophagus sp. MUCL 43196]
MNIDCEGKEEGRDLGLDQEVDQEVEIEDKIEVEIEDEIEVEIEDGTEVKIEEEKEFWTKAENPIDDKHVLIYLYENNFLDISLNISPPDDHSDPIVNKFWSCFNESLKVNKKGSDEKRRILSIIANDFLYEEIKSNLSVVPTTIFDACKYARLNGPDAKQIEKPIRTVAKLSQEKLEQFSNFFEDKANIIMSSYKSDAKTQLPVLYLKNTKKALWEKFQETYPNVFECLKNLIQKEINSIEIQNNFIQRAKDLQCYLKRSYEQKFTISENGTTRHDPCINHCLLYAFGTCDKLHTQICNECQKLFTFFNDPKEIISLASLADLKIYEKKLIYYLSHQTKKVYLNSQFNTIILELNEEGAVFLVDYKMKILPQTARETKQDFYGKKGCNAKQDAWFTTSSLHRVIEVLDKKPEWISIISDNGPHYHNSELMIILSYWKEWYDIKVNKWVFLEAGKISQSIKRRVKLEFEIRNGENIQKAIEDIARICVAHLEPDRDNENKENKVKTIPGISNYFKWRWPEEEGLDRYIQARALSHIEKLENREIMMNEKENRVGMIEILENEMAKEMQTRKIGKRIAPQVIALLERFFLEGNVHKNRRMNGYNMRDKLVEKQESSELVQDIKIPKVSSINN